MLRNIIHGFLAYGMECSLYLTIFVVYSIQTFFIKH